MGDKHIIHQSLIRNQTFLLADRQLCMSLVFLCIVIACMSLTVYGFLLANFLFLSGYSALYLMQQHDPFLWRVYTRNLRYKELYTAQELLSYKGYRQ